MRGGGLGVRGCDQYVLLPRASSFWNVTGGWLGVFGFRSAAPGSFRSHAIPHAFQAKYSPIELQTEDCLYFSPKFFEVFFGKTAELFLDPFLVDGSYLVNQNYRLV